MRELGERNFGELSWSFAEFTKISPYHSYTVFAWWLVLHIFVSFTIVNTTPLLKDLYQHITPQYAKDWKAIGTLLCLPSKELNWIEFMYPTNAKWCCNEMLEVWLEMDNTASWGKLLTVIGSPAIFYSSPDKGMHNSCMWVNDFVYGF